MATSLPQLQTLLETALAERCFSGCQLYAEHASGTISLALGKTSYWDPSQPINESTHFDIGSVTKAVFTTTAFALLLQEKKISLEDTVEKWDARFSKTALGKLNCADLLAHCSGLVWWYPLHSEVGTLPWDEWFLANGSKLVESKPRVKAIYSDPGFWALGLLLKAIYPTFKGDFRKLFDEKVKAPLGLSDMVFGKVSKNSCAATEYAQQRGGVVHGEVFDENCAALGGAFTHAGLFASAKALGPLARHWLRAVRGEKSILNKDVAKLFTQRSNFVPNSTWALGWDTKSEKGSSAGQYFSPKSFGMLGFPGCSIWIDPEQNGFVVFLSNRVHPSRFDERIREIRPAVHDAVSVHWRGSQQ